MKTKFLMTVILILVTLPACNAATTPPTATSPASNTQETNTPTTEATQTPTAIPLETDLSNSPYPSKPTDVSNEAYPVETTSDLSGAAYPAPGKNDNAEVTDKPIIHTSLGDFMVASAKLLDHEPGGEPIPNEKFSY